MPNNERKKLNPPPGSINERLANIDTFPTNANIQKTPERKRRLPYISLFRFPNSKKPIPKQINIGNIDNVVILNAIEPAIIISKSLQLVQTTTGAITGTRESMIPIRLEFLSKLTDSLSRS